MDNNNELQRNGMEMPNNADNNANVNNQNSFGGNTMDNRENNFNQNTVDNNSEAPVFAEKSAIRSDISKQDTQPVSLNGYQPAANTQQSAPAGNNISSSSAQNQQYPYTQQYHQVYPYTSQYNGIFPYNVMNNAPHKTPKPKKKGKGKFVAIAAGTLALALCVGVGGGMLGSYLVSSNSTAVETSIEASTANESGSSNNTSGALNITRAEETSTTPTSTQEVAAKVRDAVVEITTETTQYDAFYGQYVSQAAGSGVIISKDGYILTNNHVIEDASTITVRLTNGKTYTAKLIGKDATLDVALIKIEENNLTTATFGDSSKLCVGQTAIAIGNPLGQLGGTVTDGIISALDREIKIDGKTMNLLQTNAAINPGNSGGGLFDANGNLIGLVVAKSSSTSTGTSVEGLGFAIPANDIVDILEDLKTKGYVTGRGSLGINVVTVSGQEAMFMYRVDKEGVYVSAVTSGGAADKAGLKVGDCITEFDGKAITTGSELTAAVSKRKAGEKVNIKITRDGKEQTIEVTLGEKVADSTTSSENNRQSSGNYYYGGGSSDFGDGFFGIG